MKNRQINSQLEISFTEAAALRAWAKASRESRRTRTHQWFQRMKILVNAVVEWRPAFPSTPTQTELPIETGQRF